MPARGRRLATIGAMTTALGILMYYLLERVSYNETSSITFRSLEAAFLPTTGIGLLMSTVGTIMLAVSSTPRPLSQLGCALLGVEAAAALTLFCYPNAINIHEWTGLFVFPLSLLPLLGSLLLISALIKTVRRGNR